MLIISCLDLIRDVQILKVAFQEPDMISTTWIIFFDDRKYPYTDRENNKVYHKGQS